MQMEKRLESGLFNMREKSKGAELIIPFLYYNLILY